MSAAYAPGDDLLRHHGDADVGTGVVDLAVNVRAGTPPPWLRSRLARVDLAQYPVPGPAVAALARRHERPEAEVLVTSGAAEAFVLIARALTPRSCAIVHPQFTEPEIALRAAAHDVSRVVLGYPFVLDPARVPEEAAVVVVGNPTNPTSVLHPAAALRSLARPGRILVVDEAFADCVPGEAQSLAACRDVEGLVVVRSLTKTWGLAGLRAGYVLADAATITLLASAQPRWPVSAPALEACRACSTPAAISQAQDWSGQLSLARSRLVESLETLDGVHVVPNPQASFVLVRTDRDGHAVRDALRARGFAVRRADTFPGLGPDWSRIAVRDHDTCVAFAAALKECV